VVNNWEATSFSFDAERVLTLIDQTADVGAELFLLDDGWFGDTHPRNDDTAGLGDWQVDKTKLPDGLTPLLKRAADRGIQFGLWVEPEMVSPESRLYADHPDWVVGQPARHRRTFRHQLVLDVLRPEVARFIHGVVDGILAENPGISYLKWDANRPLTDPGSSTLPADRQANLWVDQPRATWLLMEAVAKSHPAQMLMLCASGGGRVDLGTLRWFHEVWLSDNTDPVDRVRMQWAASYFLPANVVAAHVTRWGNRPIAFACAVAMSARFGFDIDLAGLSEEERAICRRAVRFYREIRPVVQLGDLWRLIAPEKCASLAYVSQDGDRAVVFAFQIETRTADVDPLRLGALHPDQTYEITAVDLATEPSGDPVYRSGSDLLERGLEWPLGEACTSCMWTLTAV
jgi:alpha-galactosidase